MTCANGRRWTDEEKRRLRELCRSDRATLIGAFPDRTPTAVLCAAHRCASKPRMDEPPVAIDGNCVRAKLKAFPIDRLLDALPTLMQRTANYRPEAAIAGERAQTSTV